MNALMYSPAGFRRAPALRRARVLPFRRRGFGDAAADYRAVAATLTPGSADYQLAMGCANNPTAPACVAGALQNALSTPYLTAPEEAAVRSAQAVGATPPTFQAHVGTPIPISPVTPPAQTVQVAAAPQTATPQVPSVVQPVMVQPANAPSPTDNTQPAPVGFLSTTILGIPLWIWGAGAVGAYFVFGQGGRYGR